jgi:hypothetical protein
MRVSFHINNPYIGDFIGLSMKILLSLIICSQIHTVRVCHPMNGQKHLTLHMIVWCLAMKNPLNKMERDR